MKVTKSYQKVGWVAKRLGLSIWTIYRMAEEGTLPHHKFGRSYRFLESEIENWIATTHKGPSELVGQK